MKYINQLLTVTLWEYRRFFKPKNELLGIAVMLVLFTFIYFGGKYVTSVSKVKPGMMLLESIDPQLTNLLSEAFVVEKISFEKKGEYLAQIQNRKKGLLLLQKDTGFVIHSWKRPASLNKLQEILNEYNRVKAMKEIELSASELEYILIPASLEKVYFDGSGARVILVYFFAGLMIMAVMLSFANQFTAITGEKQMNITEQIVSAIKPQVWMDGKILGITLTALSAVLMYTIISILGGVLFFQFTNVPISNIVQILHLPSILVFLIFTMMGVLIWNALLAAIASIITDPNNSAKSSLMFVPLLFVISTLVISPYNKVAVFLSWFPLTSATAMPMRLVVSVVDWWQLAGSFVVLTATFILLRKLAAKIFRVSILISGKEPTWNEILKLSRES